MGPNPSSEPHHFIFSNIHKILFILLVPPGLNNHFHFSQGKYWDPVVWVHFLSCLIEGAVQKPASGR
jgi:hypothetical protein